LRPKQTDLVPVKGSSARVSPIHSGIVVRRRFFCWGGRVRRETGRRQEVGVLGEGLASHTGPESCAAVREDRGEALTGECVGQPLSGENQLRGADVLRPAEGNTARVENARRSPTPRRRRPWHAQTPPAREPGDLQAVRVRRHADRVRSRCRRSRWVGSWLPAEHRRSVGRSRHVRNSRRAGAGGDEQMRALARLDPKSQVQPLPPPKTGKLSRVIARNRR